MTTKHMRMLATLALVGSSLALAACDETPPADPDAGPGTDAFVPETDSGPTPDEDGGPMPTTGCAAYCTQMMTNCTGDNAQYADAADCMTTCTALAWPEGDPGATGGNSIQCRIYHGGAPAVTGPAEHCPHAGPTGGGVCGAALTFRTDMASAYTRVDRMGMPAVSTALIPSARKNAYNDASLSDDAAGMFVPDLAATLTAVHTALDDDLTTAGLTPCSMTTLVGTLPECFGQEIAAGVSVASLVVPDTLQINPAADAGFPNGRMLADPVIDVTLSVILLRMGSPCGAGMTCNPTTLFNGPAPAPLNPPMNDVAFLTTFPYLAAPHAP
jgi:hypothetical protein